MKPIQRVIRNIINDVKFGNKTISEAVEMLTDMVESLSSKTTANKMGLYDRLQEKSIEQPDNQEALSNKKDRIYTDKEMEDFAEWCGLNAFNPDLRDWYLYDDDTTPVTIAQLREKWENERRAK